MAIVLVEGVEDAVADLMHLAGGQILDAAVAGDAVDCLQVILVPEGHFRTGGDDGLMEGKAHSVFLEQQAAAGPAGTRDFAIRALDVVNVNDFHCSFPYGASRLSADGR